MFESISTGSRTRAYCINYLAGQLTIEAGVGFPFKFSRVSKPSAWWGQWSVQSVEETVVGERVVFTHATLSGPQMSSRPNILRVDLTEQLQLSDRRQGRAGLLIAQAINDVMQANERAKQDPHRNRGRASARVERCSRQWLLLHNVESERDMSAIDVAEEPFLDADLDDEDENCLEQPAWKRRSIAHK
jgi:hypothetical protein